MRSGLLDAVRRFITRERLLVPGEPVHVAVSGGIDSMVLLHVLRVLGHSCSVLHVDHGLRGAESDADHEFVEAHCRREGIPIQSKRVDVAGHAKERGLSIQMAARELRHAFMHGVSAHSEQKIAVAHHSDDAIETLLMHLMRGTGSQGWSAIKPRSGNVVRPLLHVDRAEIRAYAKEHDILFREDSSNAGAKYLRNRIRHELLPALEQLRPGARRSLARSLAMLRQLTKAAEARTGEIVSGIDRRQIPFSVIEGSGTPDLVLHELLAGHGFHPDVIERMHDAILERHTGAEFNAGGWRAIVDREHLIIGPVHAEQPAFTIEPHQMNGAVAGFRWRLSDGEPVVVPDSMEEVVLDADRLDFPLVLRPWQAGDRMRPIGLGGSKLVSDLLIDAKVPRARKDLVYVLISRGDVAWLAGHRIGEGFQATATTVRTLRIGRE